MMTAGPGLALAMYRRCRAALAVCASLAAAVALNLGGAPMTPAWAAGAQECFPPPTSCRISSHFGNRFHPVRHEWRLHKGTDFACPTGTPLVSVEDGIVSRASYDVGGGNFVVVRGKSGREFKYLHMSHFAESAARMLVVQVGTMVGNSGNTGKWTTGPHLHFEAWVGGTPMDAEKFICGASPAPAEDMGESMHENPASGTDKPSDGPEPQLGLDESLYAILDNIVSSRSLNPDYASQLSTLSRQRLYAELSYMEAASLRLAAEKRSSKERVEVMFALRHVLLGEKLLQPQIQAARATALTR